ncbi:hypothetical protein B0J12DRAFT_723308 [Macrophomina phaseolina]|uniref:DUF6594 domain-containing protein n=1 Tax=Macrophomina phaseolina TaxID=35725 RepID=A0ABQ8GVK1_9PEZI|nr:hypothetical protein B0J12DRAFT_723308 [Macrophomina phaseolina]
MSGYNKLPTLRGAHPELAVFRRFAAVNAQNVLLLQAEIVDLERELRKSEEGDKNSSDPARSNLGRDWYALSQPGRDNPRIAAKCEGEIESSVTNEQTQHASESRQYMILLELRSKLKEHNDALLQQAQMAELHHPSKPSIFLLSAPVDDGQRYGINITPGKRLRRLRRTGLS